MLYIWFLSSSISHNSKNKCVFGKKTIKKVYFIQHYTVLQLFQSRMIDKAVTERNYCNMKGSTLFNSFLLLTFVYNVVDNNCSNE